eukprot:707639-Hanusia_phi.AAC.1
MEARRPAPLRMCVPVLVFAAQSPSRGSNSGSSFKWIKMQSGKNRVASSEAAAETTPRGMPRT